MWVDSITSLDTFDLTADGAGGMLLSSVRADAARRRALTTVPALRSVSGEITSAWPTPVLNLSSPFGISSDDASKGIPEEEAGVYDFVCVGLAGELPVLRKA